MATTKLPSETDDALDQVRQALGHAHPSVREIWQKAFDYDEGHLLRLVELGPLDEPDPADLVDYCLDLTYEEVQPDLFRYALPLCLSAWREDLFGRTSKYGGFVERFYTALVRTSAIERLLSAGEGQSVTAFIQRTILDEIAAQRGLAFRGSRASAYRWFHAVATSGVVLPDIAGLWREWWTIRNPGQAYAVIQYVSCLVYDDDVNPVFAPWTRSEGGGPPTLWEYAGFLYDDCWQPSNVAFLKENVTVDSLSATLQRAVAQLANLPDSSVARSVGVTFAARTDVVCSRCEDLLRFLGRKQASSTNFQWSR